MLQEPPEASGQACPLLPNPATGLVTGGPSEDPTRAHQAFETSLPARVCVCLCVFMLQDIRGAYFSRQSSGVYAKAPENQYSAFRRRRPFVITDATNTRFAHNLVKVFSVKPASGGLALTPVLSSSRCRPQSRGLPGAGPRGPGPRLKPAGRGEAGPHPSLEHGCTGGLRGLVF